MSLNCQNPPKKNNLIKRLRFCAQACIIRFMVMKSDTPHGSRAQHGFITSRCVSAAT